MYVVEEKNTACCFSQIFTVQVIKVIFMIFFTFFFFQEYVLKEYGSKKEGSCKEIVFPYLKKKLC